MISNYVQHKLYALAVLLVVIGGLNWGYVAFTGKDFVTYALGKGALTNAIFLFVGLAAIAIAFFRDTYLPFLGPTVMPCEVLQVSVPEHADYELRVFVKPGAKVIYWAAEPENKDMKGVKDWRKAYLSFRNAGIAVADNDGYATLKLRKPQPYTVPIKGELHPHIHYRVCRGNGMMSRVMTVTLDGREYFGMKEDEEEGFFSKEDEEEGFFSKEDEEEGFFSKEDEEEGFATKEDEEEGFFAKEDEEEGFAAKEDEEEGFATKEDEEEGFFAKEDEEEGFAAKEDEEENFTNNEVNAIARATAARNLMTQEGGVLEGPRTRGADLDAAFAPAV